MSKGTTGHESEQGPPPIEMVNDLFWLKRATVLLQESPQKYDEGAERVATGIAWFWTIYAAAVSTSLIFFDKAVSIFQLILVIAPAIFLFVAYVLAVWASLPVPIRFNVVAPAEIKKTHEQIIATKQKRLLLSLVISALAVLLISFAIIIIYLNKPGDGNGMMFAVNHSTNGNELIIDGTLPDKTEVMINVTAAGDSITQHKLVRVGKENYLSVLIPVKTAAEYQVDISWVADGRRTTLQQVVKPTL